MPPRDSNGYSMTPPRLGDPDVRAWRFARSRACAGRDRGLSRTSASAIRRPTVIATGRAERRLPWRRSCRAAPARTASMVTRAKPVVRMTARAGSPRRIAGRVPPAGGRISASALGSCPQHALPTRRGSSPRRSQVDGVDDVGLADADPRSAHLQDGRRGGAQALRSSAATAARPVGVGWTHA